LFITETVTRQLATGGEVNYIFNQDQHRINGWTKPEGIADLYYLHGPGSSGRETFIGSHRFSDHFPLAAYPLRQYNGEQLQPGDIVKGAYPWISPRGSEVFFMGRSTFHGADRSGGTMAGFRTRGQLWHLDGEVNNGRGNPTDSYNHFANAGGNQYAALVRAYENRRYPGNGAVMGKNSWSNLFFRPLGQFPTSWSATAETTRAATPLNPFPESYGFWLTGNRYDEVTFPLYADDLLAYYPMNEPLYQDQSMLRPHMHVEPGAPNPEAIRRFGIDHIKNQTADLSAHQHTAALRNGASYPFEYYNVKALWANSGVLKDQNEGAVGNSIFFGQTASVGSTIGSSALQQLAANQSFSAAFWVNTSTAATPLNLLSLDGVLNVSLHNNQLAVDVDNSGAQQRFTANVNQQSNQWQHIAVSWQLGELRISFNGTEVARHSVNADLTINAGVNAALTIGPNGTGAGNVLLKIDEVYLYAAALSDRDIETLAYKKRVFGGNGGSYFQSSGMAQDYPQVAADIDLSFVANSGEVSLGEALFNSTALSRDNTISCASCHQAGRDFTDGQQFATGIGGRSTRFNTPTLVNALLADRYFYSGAADSLEVQSIHTILQNGEMGVADAGQIVSALPDPLRNQLRSVYQTEPGVSEVARAIAAFVKTIRVTANLDANTANLSAAALRGRQLFNGKANCIACHSGSNLTDNSFHDIGLNNSGPDRQAATARSDDQFRHKTPTLRNVAFTAPYFHDGSAADLAAVVRHYNDDSHRAGGRITDAMLHPLELNQAEIDDLVAYLNSLTGRTVSGN
jgi:cytochrome c peroxidase